MTEFRKIDVKLAEAAQPGLLSLCRLCFIDDSSLPVWKCSSKPGASRGNPQPAQTVLYFFVYVSDNLPPRAARVRRSYVGLCS